MGGFSVAIDDQIIGNYNAASTVLAAGQILAFYTGMLQGEHVLNVTNMESEGLAIDGFEIWGDGICCFG